MKKKIMSIILGAVMTVSLMGSMTASASNATSSTSNTSIAGVSEIKVAKGTVTYKIDMTKYEKGKKIRLWVPVAATNETQEVGDVMVKSEGGKSELNKDELGNSMVYIEWDENTEPSKRTAEISFHVIRPEGKSGELKEEGVYTEDLVKYLGASKMVVIDGKVKTLADEITKGKETNLEKARAIYDWVISNMNRNEDVKGCGTGEVEQLLVSLEGKCTDINSVFVALCRASGIPAREMFGVRMNADDITKNQHCWAQFYLPGTGWVYADPADVLKAVLKNKWSKDQKEALELKEYFFGNVDEVRVELSRGRDLILSPKQAEGPLNNFGYPYAEIDGKAIDCLVPADFVYTISFTKDK